MDEAATTPVHINTVQGPRRRSSSGSRLPTSTSEPGRRRRTHSSPTSMTTTMRLL